MKYWIWLAELRGISTRQKIALLKQFADPAAIYEQDEAGYASAGLQKREIQALSNKKLEDAERILALCDQKGIQILTYGDSRYPNRLRQIEQPPVLLYQKGRMIDFDTLPTIAAVGTRKASAYGMVQAKRLGYQMGRCGLAVISGIAKGIDAAALEGALLAGTPVAAVLGCGADVVYPRENRALYAEVQSYGCLLTEYPPGTPPEGRHFPVRNRILSGLALGVLVIEAGERSGALITARLALEQGRDVFAVPANLGVEGARGSNHLLREGAIYTENGWDVAREYWHLYPNILSEPQPEEPTESEEMRQQFQEKTPNSAAKDDKKYIDKQNVNSYIDLHEIWKSMTEEEQAVAELLQTGPAHVDTLIERSQIPASRILATLTLLEVRGIVKRLPGRMYSLAEACSDETRA